MIVEVMNAMMILVIVIGIIIIIMNWDKQEQMRRKSWRDFGRRLGLRSYPKMNPGLFGEYKDHSLDLTRDVVHSYCSIGISPTYCTKFVLLMKLDKGFTKDLNLIPGDNKYRKLTGMEDIEIGDLEIDFEYSIRCRDTVVPRMLISPSAKAHLVKLKGWTFRWNVFQATARKNGIVLDVDELEAVVKLLYEVTVAIEAFEAFQQGNYIPG